MGFEVLIVDKTWRATEKKLKKKKMRNGKKKNYLHFVANSQTKDPLQMMSNLEKMRPL